MSYAIETGDLFNHAKTGRIRALVEQSNERLLELSREIKPDSVTGFWYEVFSRLSNLQKFAPYFLRSVTPWNQTPLPSGLQIECGTVPRMPNELMHALTSVKDRNRIAPVYVPPVLGLPEAAASIMIGNGMLISAGLHVPFLGGYDESHDNSTKPGWKAVGSIPLEQLCPGERTPESIRSALKERGLIPATLTDGLLATQWFDARSGHTFSYADVPAFLTPGRYGKVPGIQLFRDFNRSTQLQVGDRTSELMLPNQHILAVWPLESITSKITS